MCPLKTRHYPTFSFPFSLSLSLSLSNPTILASLPSLSLPFAVSISTRNPSCPCPSSSHLHDNLDDKLFAFPSFSVPPNLGLRQWLPPHQVGPSTSSIGSTLTLCTTVSSSDGCLYIDNQICEGVGWRLCEGGLAICEPEVGLYWKLLDDALGDDDGVVSDDIELC